MSQSRIVRLPKQQGPVTGIRFACPFLLRSPQQNVQTKPSPMMVCDQAATSGLPQACSISSPANIFAPQATVREKTLFNIGTAKMKSTRKDLKEIVRFTSVDGKDSVARDGVSTVIKTKYYCISAMEEYKDLSMEEIRHEAYKTRNNPLRSKPLCFTGGNLFDDEDDNTRVIKQNQYLSSSLHGSRSSPQYDHTGKLAHKLIPIAMLDKLTRQRLDTFVAAAYGKEAEVCKLEKETVKIMEKAERNICNIESYVDFYVNYLCIQLRKRGETFKLQAQQNIKSVTSQGSQMLSELVSERDNLEKSIIDISQIMSSGGTSESITFYKSQLHMIHSLMDRQRQPLKLELKSATMNYSKEMLNGFQDLFRTEAYTPRYLHYLRCVSSASPVIGVCPLNDRRIAVAYEDRLEIRNLHLEEIRHVVCSEFKVVGLATAGEKLLILHRNAANSYEVSMIDIELKNIKKLFNTNLVTSIFSNWQPDIFSNFKRIVITEPATQKLHIYDNEGMRLNCLKLDVSPYTLAIVNKSTLLVNNGIGTKKLNFVVDGFGWVVHTDSTELQKPKSTQGFSSTALKSKTTAFKFIAQQPNTVVNPTAVNQPNALSTPSEESRANKPHKGQTPETINGNTKQEIVRLSCQAEQLTFGPKQKQFHFAKSGDENGFYYLSQGSGSDPVKDGTCIKVFSDEGIVSTLDIMLEDIKDITGIAVSGDKIVIACGAQGLKLFSVK